MSMKSIVPGHRAANFIKLFVCILTAFTLAIGGVTMAPRPVQAISISAAPAAVINVNECQPFAIQFTAAGTSCTPPPDPFFWFWPALPSYATLDSSTGLLTGCPQVGDASAVFVVGVSEFSPPACGPFVDSIIVTINVVPGPAPCNMVINPTFYPVAWEGLPFSMPLSVSGGVGPYSWSATGLPAGLSVTDNATGTISGTPDPGTCGIYTVTATVADLGTCCCPPVSRPFVLIVDCWANYPPFFYFTTACDFEVGIGSGLTYGQTNVTIDGSYEATLAGGESQTFTSIPCESHMVIVDQTVPGQDPRTRFAVTGAYYQRVTDVDNYANFDYAQEVLIETGSEPVGIAHPSGTGFYAVGSDFISSVPSPVTSSEAGTKYIFLSWSLPDGNKNPNRDLVYQVSQTGIVKAEYDTYYLLTLKSDSPVVEESTWELKDSTATYNLALQPRPIPGFWGVLGGVNRPLNASGSHLMTGPYTQVINWSPDYTIPIIVLLVILLLVIGLVVVLILVLRRKPAGAASSATAATAAQTTQPATTTTSGTKETISKADSGDKPNFCPNCGAPVEKDAVFCKKCGNKLV